MEDSSELSKQTRAAGIAFAVLCSITAAQNFMKQANAKAFNRAMGSGTNKELRNSSSGITVDMVSAYPRLPTPTGITQVLNLEMPGTEDVLAVFLEALSKQSRGGSVAFQRKGVFGFDVIAGPLAEETVKAVSGAT